jgi:thiol-disulfide isomerase/thioredoxin
MQSATTNEARAEASKNQATATVPLVARAQKLIDANAKDAASLDALVFVATASPRTAGKALELLAEHHAASPKVVALINTAGQLPGGEAFLKAVLEKNSDSKAKGVCCYQLGVSSHRRNDEKAAETYFSRIEKEFAAVEIGKTRAGKVVTLGEQAKKYLFEIRNLAIGKTAPEIVSHDLTGAATKLSALRGKVVVLDIWATWCPPCRAMIPHEREMVEKLKDRPFALVSISADEKKETLTQFLEKEPMPWTHWWEGNTGKGMLNDWNIQFFPTIYVIDAKGVIRHKGLRGKAMEEAVEKLLSETK